jgi:hypothetical protein
MKAKHPMQPIVRDSRGTYRFKQNAIVNFLLDAGPNDMNKLACMPFSRDDRVQFAQLIGYSVDGAAELSYMDRNLIAQADAEIARQKAMKLTRKKKGGK